MRISNTNYTLRTEHAVYVCDVSENVKEQLKQSHFNSPVIFSFYFGWENNSRYILASSGNCFSLHPTHKFAQDCHDFSILSPSYHY